MWIIRFLERWFRLYFPDYGGLFAVNVMFARRWHAGQPTRLD